MDKMALLEFTYKANKLHKFVLKYDFHNIKDVTQQKYDHRLYQKLFEYSKSTTI